MKLTEQVLGYLNSLPCDPRDQVLRSVESARSFDSAIPDLLGARVEIQVPGAQKLSYLSDPILFVWDTALGKDRTVELIWTWTREFAKYRGYSCFLIPFTSKCAQRHGCEFPMTDPLEISIVGA